MMNNLEQALSGRDLRTLSGSRPLVESVHTQSAFDELIRLLLTGERAVAMRAADVAEKVSRQHPQFLQKHKESLLGLSRRRLHKELQWHLAQLLPRLQLSNTELREVWGRLAVWALDGKRSRIVRVNALQSLYDLNQQHGSFERAFDEIVRVLDREQVPSISARIRKLRKG